MESRAIPGSSPLRFLPVALLIALIPLRIWLGTLPGYPGDLHMYKRWAVWGGSQGVHTLYDEGSRYDYPPLYGYLLAPAGKVQAYLDPEYTRELLRKSGVLVTGVEYSPGLSLLVKIPPLIFDVLIAWLLWSCSRRLRLWGEGDPEGSGGHRGPLALGAWLPALVFLLHPAVLFLSGYWGQPDSIESFFVLLALALILLRKPEWGWVAAALGCLMKPLAVPYLPLLALATLVRCGWPRVLTAGATGLGAFVLGFLPFVITGRAGAVVQKFVSDIDAMPFTSVNGHNLWWLLGAWRPAADPWLGPVTPKAIGLGLFGVAYLLLLAALWRAEGRSALSSSQPSTDPSGDIHWFAAAAFVGFSFFTLSTHMHENHLYPVLPLLILLAGRSLPWAAVGAVASLAIFVNMGVHDLFIGDALLAGVGGTTEIPARTVVWYQLQGGGLSREPYLSRLEVGLAYANALVVVACYVGLMALTFGEIEARRRSRAAGQ